MEAPLLEVKDVTKSYFENGKEFKVLDLVRFELAERDFVCVVGPSGCGKSTLLRIIVGLEPPTSGQVLFEGSPIRADNPQVAMVFQSFALFPRLTVTQNVALGLEAQGISPEDRHGRDRRTDASQPEGAGVLRLDRRNLLADRVRRQVKCQISGTMLDGRPPWPTSARCRKFRWVRSSDSWKQSMRSAVSRTSPRSLGKSTWTSTGWARS